MSNQKGFTVIELIVVIAIIAVLAAVVLVNVTQYMDKGKDAAIRGNLSSLVARGTKFFEDSTLGNGKYNNFCGHPSGGAPVYTAITDAKVGGSWVCTCDNPGCIMGTATKWCACSVLHSKTGGSNDTFCVDSTGFKGVSQVICGTRCVSGFCN